MADKVANAEEKSVDPLDSGPRYDEPAETSAGQERLEELNRGFLDFHDRYLNGYTENGDLIGSWIGPQAGTNYWFGALNRLQFKIRHQKVNPQHVPGEGTVMDAVARGDC